MTNHDHDKGQVLMQVCLPFLSYPSEPHWKRVLYNTTRVLLSFLKLSGGPESSTAMPAYSANYIGSDEYAKLTLSLLNMH